MNSIKICQAVWNSLLLNFLMFEHKLKDPSCADGCETANTSQYIRMVASLTCPSITHSVASYTPASHARSWFRITWSCVA
ncbi:hypothetical protein CLF_105905 [Clonorchis sinensis]|uniref:Uncharacterized protein n=1 Tax=Clonorchis sinensis TaxID=79923 RepID=G7YED4_CLOSI|nr:hypothetical protein CLF_105905 [Clonorchis sinensis]